MRDDDETVRRDAAHAAHAAHEPSDLSAFDLYFVCLHVANLVIAAENAKLSLAIRRRFQRMLDDVVAEYDAAVRERDELQVRFDR